MSIWRFSTSISTRRWSFLWPMSSSGAAYRLPSPPAMMRPLCPSASNPSSVSRSPSRFMPCMRQSVSSCHGASAVMPRTALLAQSSALISRLKSLAAVSEADTAYLMRTLGPVEHYASGMELLREGEVIPAPRYILHGWALRTRFLSDGRRQIFGFVLPGDAIGLCEREQPLALTTIVSCTPLALCDATAARDACLGINKDFPQITRAHQLAMALDEAYLLHQIIRIGRQTAYERLVHLILELHSRSL